MAGHAKKDHGKSPFETFNDKKIWKTSINQGNLISAPITFP